jgi:hypothetical protein
MEGNNLSCASSEDIYMDDDSSSNISNNISNIDTNSSGKGGRDKRGLETVTLTVASGALRYVFFFLF